MTIELAIIAPIMILLMFGIIEFSMVMYGTSVIESATSNTSRLGKTGYTEETVSREELIHDMLSHKIDGLMDTELVSIETKVYGDFGDIGQPEPYNDQNANGSYDAGEPFDDINGNAQWDADMGAAGLGAAREVVVYTVNYPWQLHTPVIRELLGDAQGIYNIRSSMVVRNEPYDTQVSN